MLSVPVVLSAPVKCYYMTEWLSKQCSVQYHGSVGGRCTLLQMTYLAVCGSVGITPSPFCN